MREMQCAAGMQCVLSKPYTVDNIKAAVDKYARRRLSHS